MTVPAPPVPTSNHRHLERHVSVAPRLSLLQSAAAVARGSTSALEVQASAPVTVSFLSTRWTLDRVQGGNRRMAAPLEHQLWQTLSCGQDRSTHSRGVTPCDRQGPSGAWLGKAARLTSMDCPWRATGQVKGGRVVHRHNSWDVTTHLLISQGGWVLLENA